MNRPPGCQDLHAVVLPVGELDVTVLVHTNTTSAVKLADATAGAAACRQTLSIGGELLDAVVAPMRFGHRSRVFLVVRTYNGRLDCHNPTRRRELGRDKSPRASRESAVEVAPYGKHEQAGRAGDQRFLTFEAGHLAKRNVLAHEILA